MEKASTEFSRLRCAIWTRAIDRTVKKKNTIPEGGLGKRFKLLRLRGGGGTKKIRALYHLHPRRILVRPARNSWKEKRCRLRRPPGGAEKLQRTTSCEEMLGGLTSGCRFRKNLQVVRLPVWRPPYGLGGVTKTLLKGGVENTQLIEVERQNGILVFRSKS